MCASWRTWCAGSPRSIRRRPSPPRSSTTELAQPVAPPAATKARPRTTLSAAVERTSDALFRRLRRRPAAARPLPPHPARGRISAAVGGAGRDPRQPDPGRRSARRSTATRCARRSATSTSRSSAPAARSRCADLRSPSQHFSGNSAVSERICLNSATLLYKCISGLHPAHADWLLPCAPSGLCQGSNDQYRQRGSDDACRDRRACEPAGPSALLGPLAVGAGAAVGARHLRRPGRPDADHADPRRRRHAAARSTRLASSCCSASSAARSGAWSRRAGAAGRRPGCMCASSPCSRSSPRCRPSWSRSSRASRSTAASTAVLDPHPARSSRTRSIVADAYLQRARAADPRRHHRDGDRRRSRQAAVRSRPRPVSRNSSPRRPRCAALPAALMIGSRRRRSSSAPTSECGPAGALPAAVGARRRSARREPQVAMLARRQFRRRGRSSCAATTTPISTSPARSIRAWCAALRETAGQRRRICAICEARRLGVQIAFALMYTVIALIVLLSAVWIGFTFANRLVAPIRRLIGAADVVSTGNLYVQVPVRAVRGRSRPARRDLQQDDRRSCAPSATTSCAPAT